MKNKIIHAIGDGFIKCRYCGAGKFSPCVTPKGKERSREGPHMVRIKDAEKKFQGGFIVKDKKIIRNIQ